MKNAGYVQYSPKALNRLVETAKETVEEVRKELIREAVEKYQERFRNKKRFFGLLAPKPLELVLEDDLSNYKDVRNEIDKRIESWGCSIWDIDHRCEVFLDMLSKFEYGAKSKALLESEAPVFLNIEVYNAICYLKQHRKFVRVNI